MVNPDGVSLVQNGIDGIGSEELKSAVLEMAKRDKATNLPSYFRLWKNNLAGVNLNKNFDANWEKTVDTKGYPSKDEYKGTAQESEIESKALADLQRKEKFSASISYHTQGEVIYWYFGEGSYVEEARKLAKTVNRNSGYTIVNSYSENHAGGFKDFMERKYNVPSVTIECGKGTSPVSEEQIDKIWKGQKGILPDLLWES
jgi:possible gamma-D-glutamyl-L-diamino acid endopeptidase 1